MSSEICLSVFFSHNFGWSMAPGLFGRINFDTFNIHPLPILDDKKLILFWTESFINQILQISVLSLGNNKLLHEI